MRIVLWLIGIVVFVTSDVAAEPVLELTVGDKAFTGRPVAYDDNTCWLAHPDGQLSEVSLRSVSKFRKLDEAFKSLSSIDARNQLRQELGREWEIVGTGHYLVCAKAGRGRAYAEHFENLYRSFRSYFSRRGFQLPEPDFPLMALVFSNSREFAAQCRKDGVPFVRGLRGYYHRKTNRICLFEDGDNFVLGDGQLSVDVPADANIQASLKDTITHEATHQVAFNLGLHSRVGKPPRWITEGLATMFEAEGTRKNTGGKQARQRVNEERLWWFGKYRQQRRQPGSLVRFIGDERAFAKSVLDFYAEAWALTFFLAETRPREYAGYLKVVADRDPLKKYAAGGRVKDFQLAFGADVGRLEVEMLRFIDDLQ